MNHNKWLALLFMMMVIPDHLAWALEPIAPTGELWKQSAIQKSQQNVVVPPSSSEDIPSDVVTPSTPDLPYKPEDGADSNSASQSSQDSESALQNSGKNDSVTDSRVDLATSDEVQVDWTSLPVLPLKLMKLGPAPDPRFESSLKND